MKKPSELRIDGQRLHRRIATLGEVGALDGGGVCRLALTEEDRAGRDLVTTWMLELGLEVLTDRIGNVVGVWRGTKAKGDDFGEVVMTGSHIDTVRTGGHFDGNLGVLAGLEVVETLKTAGVEPERSLAVAFFTNEEGSRFAPDMMGSAVYTGAMPLEEALAARGIDGSTVRENLQCIEYDGATECGAIMPCAYVELHVEQGPVLEREGIEIGAVTGVQGISWTELSLKGVSNHAGTTPMAMRSDAGYVAAAINTFVRKLALDMGGSQVATVGLVTQKPNLVNVVPNHVVMTVDLRNTDDALLREAEAKTEAFIEETAAKEGVTVKRRKLARFAPVVFDPEVVGAVEAVADRLGCSVRRLPSGAGHDAQMFAPHCPSGMIFVPSRGGISHNIEEYTAPEHVEAGANVLLLLLLEQLTQGVS